VNETPSAVTRVDVWTQGHLKKNGEPVNKAVDETLVITNHTLQNLISLISIFLYPF
jgi:hypothetical protein